MTDLRPVGYIIGWLVVVLGLLMIPPMLFDLARGDRNAQAFEISALLTIVVGSVLAFACAGRRRPALSLAQGFLLTSCSWIVLTVIATLPLMLGAPRLGFTSAFFETMSAMTTTGGTAIADLDTLPRSVLLWRGLLQWMGGIGVVLMAMIMLPILGIGGMQLSRTADFNTIEKIAPRAKEMAISFGWIYLVLTVGCAVGYLWGGMLGFDAAVHAMTTVATGGMGNYNVSFAAFSPTAQYVSTVFMLLGAMSFVRYVQAAGGQVGPLFRDTQIRAFLLIFGILCLGVLISRLANGDSLTELTIREVLFNMASVLSTTGFASTDYTLWGSLAIALIFSAGMICGCSGSTSGGPKVFRYQILLSEIGAEIRRLYSPNVVVGQRYQGRPVTPEIVNSVIAYLMMFFLTLGIGSVALVMLGLSPITAISGAATCLSNIGPGFGPEIGPVGNFAAIPNPAKWVMIFLMLAGRLELLTLYVLLVPSFWKA